MTRLRFNGIALLISLIMISPSTRFMSPELILLRICFLVMGFLLLVMSQQVLQRTLSTTMPCESDDRFNKTQLCLFVSRLLNASMGFVSPQWVQVLVLPDICPPFIGRVTH
jgi:hypothetical protein